MRLLQRLPVTHKVGSVPHWHDNEQILVTVSGMCKLTIDGNIFDAHPGDLLFFPAGPRHCAIGTGPEGCVYYKIFAPPVRTNCRVGSDHRSCATTES
ncbi:cupin domain-containing protein [Mesorhizobium sp.]|uniref:cupin domain-containing protein n=1 Tax=Mesorhizobium sp. TaxID=1871066 RepID=UPI00344E28C3